jgi:ABC-type transporter Mla subunit MlaD
MTEDAFRIVVTVAVVLACIAFIVQAAIVFALYRVARKTQGNAERFMAKAEPVIAKAQPVLDKASGVIDQFGPVIAKTGPAIDQARIAIQRALPAIDRAGPMIDETREALAKTTVFIDRAAEVTATANLVIADARPQLAKLSQEAVEVAHLGREQAERIGDLLHDAGDKARARLAQVDQTVESTIEQVGNASVTVKRAVLRPVREVTGVAAGFSAVVSTLVRGHRRSSVDAATQDEEMFI